MLLVLLAIVPFPIPGCHSLRFYYCTTDTDTPMDSKRAQPSLPTRAPATPDPGTPAGGRACTQHVALAGYVGLRLPRVAAVPHASSMRLRLACVRISGVCGGVARALNASGRKKVAEWGGNGEWGGAGC